MSGVSGGRIEPDFELAFGQKVPYCTKMSETYKRTKGFERDVSDAIRAFVEFQSIDFELSKIIGKLALRKSYLDRLCRLTNQLRGSMSYMPDDLIYEACKKYGRPEIWDRYTDSTHQWGASTAKPRDEYRLALLALADELDPPRSL